MFLMPNPFSELTVTFSSDEVGTKDRSGLMVRCKPSVSIPNTVFRTATGASPLRGLSAISSFFVPSTPVNPEALYSFTSALSLEEAESLSPEVYLAQMS